MFRSFLNKFLNINQFLGSLRSSGKNQKLFSISIDDYLRPNGLLWQNLESYIGKEEESVRNRSQFYKKYQLFTVFFHFLSVFRFFSLCFSNSEYFQEVMLDIGPNMKSPRIFPIILFCIWSSFCLCISILWYYYQEKGKLAFMEPFIAIKFPELNANTKLSTDMTQKLDKRFRIGKAIAIQVLFFL